MAEDEDIKNRLIRFGSYLEQTVAERKTIVGSESLRDSVIAEAGLALKLRIMTDEFYTIFPEVKPKGYKTIGEQIAEKYKLSRREQIAIGVEPPKVKIVNENSEKNPCFDYRQSRRKRGI